MNPEFVLIGVLGRIKGLKGEIKLNLSQGRFILPEQLKVLFLSDRGNFVPYPLQKFNLGSKDTIVQFLGYDEPAQVQKLVGKEVFLPSEELSTPEFSMSDLEGYTASDFKAGVLGIIKRVDSYPQQLMAILDYEKIEILIPLNDHLVKNIDRVSKTVSMELPDGLLDVFKSAI